MMGQKQVQLNSMLHLQYTVLTRYQTIYFSKQNCFIIKITSYNRTNISRHPTVFNSPFWQSVLFKCVSTSLNCMAFSMERLPFKVCLQGPLEFLRGWSLHAQTSPLFTTALTGGKRKLGAFFLWSESLHFSQMTCHITGKIVA